MDSELNTRFSQLVSNYQSSRGLVGLGAIVLKNGVNQGIAVSGERAIKTGISLNVNDKWHIGSITKSVTATLVARLIEGKRLSWNTSINRVLGSSAVLHDDWKNVSVMDLLTHTSGAAPNFPLSVLFKNPKEGQDRILARRKAVFKLLKKRSNYPCKTKHVYSNVGYTIIGVLVEQITGRSWENLVRAEIFEPLGLESAGFGPPQDIADDLEQPRGHRKRFLSSKRVKVGTSTDNTPIIGPAGTIHMNLTDLAKFANEHLCGNQGEGELLSRDSYNLLHSPALDNYACGWVVNEDKTLWHNGSNTMWYAFLAFEPQSKRVIAVTANDPNIGECEDVATQILEQTKTLFK